MLRIACYSDIHGQLPEAVQCDLAVIAGDICPEGSWAHQIGFLQGPFTEWLKKFNHSVFVAGNHDQVIETNRELLPRFPGNSRYLENSLLCPTSHRMMMGWGLPGKHFTIFGTPLSLPYGHYSFMADEEEIGRRLKLATESDVIVSHGPPYGFGDWAPRYNEFRQITHYENAGSWALREHISVYQPRLVICGHIHESRGIYRCGNTVIVNAAVTGFSRDEYDRVRKFIAHPPIVVTMDEDHNVSFDSDLDNDQNVPYCSNSDPHGESRQDKNNQ